jgi:hypothetical protein
MMSAPAAISIKPASKNTISISPHGNSVLVSLAMA